MARITAEDVETFDFAMPKGTVRPEQAKQFGIGGAQGFTTDIPGGIIDFLSLLGEGASSLPPVTPNIRMLQQMKGLDKLAGSEVLGEKVYGPMPTDPDLKVAREMGRGLGIVGNVEGLATDAFSLLAPKVGGGIDSFRKLLQNQEVGVTLKDR